MRTVLFVEPFEKTRLPIATLEEHEGRIVVTRIPPPRSMDVSARALIVIAWRDIEATPSLTALPESVGPQIVFEAV